LKAEGIEERTNVMTQAAKLKSVIRARARKTGESYTAARRQVLAGKPRPALALVPPPEPPRSPAAAPPVAKDSRVPRGELSNRAAIKSTGHDLEYWFKILDNFGKTHGHTKAAEYLYAEHKVQAWHGQMIVVTWERARGLRQENQSCTGTFQVSVSRVLNASVGWVVDFFNDATARKAWLKSATPALSRALEEAFAAGKSMELKKTGYARMRYKWLSSVVELRATEKPDGKTSLVADSSDLPDADAVGVRREAFAHALDRLREIAAA
jgi:hypothetical protein